MTYETIEVKVALTSIPHNTISVDIDLLKEDLVSVDVWTKVDHGRISPREEYWENTAGVSEYFNANGSPKETYFANNQFGMSTHGYSYFNNDKDVDYDESISWVRLPELIISMAEYKYEVSEVTVYSGNTFHRGWGGRKRRKVFATCKFSRDEYFSAEEPVDHGEGWVETNHKDRSEKPMWIRFPLNESITDWDLGTVDTSGGEIKTGFAWETKLTSKRAYPTGNESETINTARDLRDFITTIYTGSSDLLTGKDVKSTFLWNDLESESPYYDASNVGSNYVSDKDYNSLNNIACIHTFNLNTDVTDSSAEGSILEVTFSDLMDELKSLVPIYWFVEDDGTLRIEHIKYIDDKLKTIDILDKEFLDGTQKWTFNKDELFETTTFNTVNSGYADFANNILEFDRIASNNRSQDLSSEYSTKILCTDVKHCFENRNDLENGVLLVAYDPVTMKMINSTGSVSGKEVENGELALSNLLNDYWRYEGVWKKGTINTVASDFKKTARNKKGTPISLKGVYDSTTSFLTTNIGIGFISAMKIDFDRGITTDISLLYRYDSDPNSDGTVLVVSDGVWFDIGNYEN
jgi:hypothetical protein